LSGQPFSSSYPLAWPQGRPRTREPKAAAFRNARASSGRVSFAQGRDRVLSQFSLMTRPGQNWRVTELVISCNIRLRLDGARYADDARREPDDTGVAVYFALDKRPHVLACDRWDTVGDNLAAIAAHVDALRGQERWGVADMAQAFAGHVALAAPEQWWQVLGVSSSSSPAEINAAWRAKAQSAHPDAGGSNAAMARLNAARDAGLQARA
jgi:hypothetical protein